MSNLIEQLTSEGLTSLNLDAGAAPVFARYAELLIQQNQVMNLTAITEPSQVAQLHFLDCAALMGCADFTGRKVIDVGTGAGFPGIPLKILNPSASVTLADSLAKRIHWLQSVAEELKLSDIECLHARAEELALAPAYRDSFDFAVSRAVASLPHLCELSLPFVKVGGYFLSMKGPDCEEEISQASSCIQLLGGKLHPSYDYVIPGTDVRHRVVIIEKIHPTPKGYPRRWAKIQKSPL